MTRAWPCVLLLGCTGGGQWPAVDLGERLGPDEARAGIVTDADTLPGGVSAEGRVGDVKIYNDRVQFVIQGPRVGDFMSEQPGAVVDADIVRAEGEVGRDIVDELLGMYGLGRPLEAGRIAVLDSGALGGPARVVVEGTDGALAFVRGALESPDLLPSNHLAVEVEYALAPGSWLLEVRSRITATSSDVTVDVADMLFGSADAAEPWAPGVGFAGAPAAGAQAVAYVGRANDVVVAVMPDVGEAFGDASATGLLRALIDTQLASLGQISLAEGESAEVVRYYGVAPDLATLTDARLALEGGPTEVFDGVVTAGDGAVVGARVHVLVDDVPFTVAFTDDAGRFAARVPAGSAARALAEGIGPDTFEDGPGAAPYGAHAPELERQRALAELRDGGHGVPQARARGLADVEAPLSLGEPAIVEIRVDDALPYEVRLEPIGPRPEWDDRLTRARHTGVRAWSRGGVLRVPVHPGRYRAVVHRGIRFELHTEEVDVAAGGEARIATSLPQAYAHPGYLLGDPHVHAAPSPDATIRMEARVLECAAVGLQLHFGTDHDHVADYRPIVDALGVGDVLASVVADEFSPPMRGHHNLYPLAPSEEGANGGAVLWWLESFDTTTELLDLVRSRNPGVRVQANHPLEGSGQFGAAGWTPGRIRDPGRFAPDIDAIEVNNAGVIEFADLYLDLVPRGLVPTPMGVSDSHGPGGGGIGLNATFLGLGVDDVSGYSDDRLRTAVDSHRTVATRGPFLAMSIPPGSTVEGGATLDVEALSPSWIEVDRLLLLRDGVEVERVAGTSARFLLDPDRDAAYVVVAEGDRPMAPVSGATPWALAAAILVDTAGDGWTPPLPPLQVGD